MRQSDSTCSNVGHHNVVLCRPLNQHAVAPPPPGHQRASSFRWSPLCPVGLCHIQPPGVHSPNACPLWPACAESLSVDLSVATQSSIRYGQYRHLARVRKGRALQCEEWVWVIQRLLSRGHGLCCANKRRSAINAISSKPGR